MMKPNVNHGVGADGYIKDVWDCGDSESCWNWSVTYLEGKEIQVTYI